MLGLYRRLHKAAFFGSLVLNDRFQGRAPEKDTTRGAPTGCFCKLWVLFVGALMIRALLFGVYFGAFDVLETPM